MHKKCDNFQINLLVFKNSRLDMQHIAIMKKSWRLTEKILAGEKTLETRWYKN